MSAIDWLIVIIPLLAVGYIGYRAQRHVKAVSDFLTGGRVAGRYVLTVASNEASIGLIAVVATFEMYYQGGFAIGFWGTFGMPIMIVITLTGFAIYRYRETRVMTMAQLFEVRYSKRFRVFAGALAWFSGVLNYALFPAVGGRFIVHYAGLPPQTTLIPGVLEVPTFGLVMFIFLSIAVAIVLLGGQLTTMVTDCVAGIFSYAMYAVIVVAVLMIFSWTQMRDALFMRPPGESMLDPFDTSKLQDFNILYVVIGIVGGIYNILSWQGVQGYNAAAVSPHEQKMGKVLGFWRLGFCSLIQILLAMAAWTYLLHPDFADSARVVEATLQQTIVGATEASTATLQNQMRVPVTVAHFLPVGVTGAFFAVMVFLLISTDTTYLHSWGSILVQDVILPLRRKAFTPRQQIWLLRLSILGVAVFAFFFSLLFNQVTQILMFFAVTGSVYLGGAGAVIIGGLYWSRGTAAGAWAAMLSGAGVAVAGLLVTQFWASPIYPFLDQHWPAALVLFTQILEGLGGVLPFVYWEVTPERFPITGQEIYLLTMVAAVASYIGVSLLTCREPFDMNRMLHRTSSAPSTAADKPAWGWKQAFLGFDDQFTWGDKLLSISVFAWSGLLFAVFLGVAAWNFLVQRFSADAWALYFYITNIGLALVVGSITTVWFTIGGIVDLRKMFRRLATLQRNVLDDGRVINHRNAEDIAFVPETSQDQQPPPVESTAAPRALPFVRLDRPVIQEPAPDA